MMLLLMFIAAVQNAAGTIKIVPWMTISYSTKGISHLQIQNDRQRQSGLLEIQ